MANRKFYVIATFDEEAKVWVTKDSNVPGLAAEASTEEELVKKLAVLIPELLELNAHLMRPAIKHSKAKRQQNV